MLAKMPEYKQIERLLRILQWLTTDREITVTGLYRKFEARIPRRTLERDLVALSSANIPLKSRPGKGREQVWYLEECFKHFIPQMIGSREVMASLLLGRFLDLVRGTSLERQAKSFLNKAKQIYDPSLIVDSDSMSSSLFAVSQTGVIDYGPHAVTIDRFLQAASEKKYCRITYKGYSHKRPTEYKIAPYVMLIRKGTLYGVSREVNGDRIVQFLIHRIRSIEVVDERFKKPRDFLFDNLVKDSIGIFHNKDAKPVEVKLKFSPDIAETISDRTWHPSQKITAHKDGSITLSMKVIISEELIGWIGSWIGYVKIMEPIELRKEIKARAADF
jgi:predicted DNA-binding transcriptional regulator YafY